MKKLIMIVACLTSLNAFALDQSSSWSDIFANAYSVNALYDLGGIALGNACVTATEVKSIAPQRVCMKWEEIYTPGHGEMGPVTEYVCKQWGTADFASPRTYTKTECLKYGNGEASECLAYGPVSYTIPATVNVEVGVNAGGEAGVRYFWKNFTFPACK